MKNTTSMFGIAVQCYQRGDLNQAGLVCQQILQADAQHADALHLLGLIVHQQGNTDRAISFLVKAISVRKTEPNFYENLGYLFKTQNRWKESIECFRQEILLKPDFADAYNRLGSVLRSNGDNEEAEICFKRAIQIRPDFADAINNLSNVLQNRGRIDEAILGYKNALRINPNFAMAHNNLGKVYLDRDMPEQAIACFRTAASLDSTLGVANANLGKSFLLQGDLVRAREAFLKSEPGRPREIILAKLALMMPPIMVSRAEIKKNRDLLELRLSELSGKFQIQDPVIEDFPVSFYLAFHGENNKHIHECIAGFYRSVCPALAFVAPHCQLPMLEKKRIKIGFYSKFITTHSVSLSYGRIICLLAESSDFEVYLVSTHNQSIDVGHVYADFRGKIVTVENNFRIARQSIADLALDILIYMDIGMEPMSYFLAFSRLARVQCVTGGHPDTAGIKTIDYFLSSETAEIEDADSHYSEKLVRLPFGFVSFNRPKVRPSFKKREEFGLPSAGNIYLCPMKLQKIHPDFDEAVSRILQADASGYVVFFSDDKYASWQGLLQKRFQTTIDPYVRERVIFLPWIRDYSDFLRIAELSDVVLDTFHFSGGTTNIATCSVGTPFVTLPGNFLRGRQGLFVAKLVEMNECIAVDTADYIKIAVDIASNQNLRAAIKKKILANNCALFESDPGISAMTKFFKNALEGQSVEVGADDVLSGMSKLDNVA